MHVCVGGRWASTTCVIMWTVHGAYALKLGAALNVTALLLWLFVVVCGCLWCYTLHVHVMSVILAFLDSFSLESCTATASSKAPTRQATPHMTRGETQGTDYGYGLSRPFFFLASVKCKRPPFTFTILSFIVHRPCLTLHASIWPPAYRLAADESEPPLMLRLPRPSSPQKKN